LPERLLMPIRSGGSTHLYFQPRTLAEAVHTLATHGGQILSGGTDFYPSLGDRAAPSDVIDISRIAEMQGIRMESDHVRIGGRTTWTEIIRTPLPRCFDALKAAAREVGSVQIQNRGTVAGNLCNASPAADGVPPLLALDAEVELISAAGTRRLPLNEFVIGNRKTQRRSDEMLSAVIVPRDLEDAASSFLKLGARRYLVISIAMVAAVVKVDPPGTVAQARVAVGSCSVTARRLVELERDLVGVAITPGWTSRVFAAHLRPLSPIDDVRASAAYRNDAALTLVRRALEACVEGH
jgi:CO/xanthine dehydrogenase FAD-binding subunit